MKKAEIEKATIRIAKKHYADTSIKASDVTLTLPTFIMLLKEAMDEVDKRSRKK